MKKRKLKLKKSVWILFVVLLFVVVGVYSAKKIHENILYKKTNEYKLLEVGYSKDEIKLLEEKTSQEFIETLFTQEKQESLIAIINEKYYLAKNLERYLNYKKANPDISSEYVVSLVNVFRDYEYYTHDVDTNISLDNLILTNKYYHLTSDYEPNLVNVNNKYYYGDNHKLIDVAYQAFIDLWNDAYKEGIYFIINSSYRSYQEQEAVYNDFKNSSGLSYADKFAARPGYSEHQTGLAIDIFTKTYTNTSNFKESDGYEWLKNNAYRFGFIERYPENKENITGFSAEAWHWRYVGVEVATYIHNENITFDEYYAYFLEK